MSVNEYDAVIVGGGIVGAVQALLLAQQGISTLLIEATQPETITEPLQQRSVCLLYTSPSPRDLSTSRMPSSA